MATVRRVLLCGVCGAAFTATPVYAQSTTVNANPAPSSSTTAPAPAPTESGLADIIVTAQRRSESLQRAAIAATAVSGDALVSAGVTEPVQLTKLIPALTVQPAGLSSSFFIRGVGATAINSFQENAIAFSVGGVFYARPTAPSGAFYDLDRIEVLKGPQGTLYGRNATGGAINLIPKLPQLDRFRGDITAEYGNYNAKKLSGGINIPLGSTLALRVAGQVVDRDGYLSDGYDDEKAQAVRASLLFQPSSDFSMLLSGDYSHQGGKGIGSVLFPSPQTPNVPNPNDRIGSADPRITAILQQVTFDQFSKIPPFSSFPPAVVRNLVTVPLQDGFQRSDFYGVSSTINGNLGFADLTTIVAYRKSKPDVLTYNPGFPSRFVENDDQMTAELRLSSKNDGPLKYVVGAFYFFEKQDGYNNYNQGAFANTEYYPRLTTESKAVFGQLAYGLTDTFRLVGGGRYTSESKTLVGQTRNTSLFLAGAPFVPISGDLDFDKFTWKAGFEWDAGARSLVYGNVSTGFKAGGFYPSVGANTYAPETLTAFTLGSKNRFFSNKFQANFEVFYWKYNNQQISYVGPIEATPGNFAQAGVTVNAGKARMYGAEAEFLYQPTSADTFGVTVQYLNAKYQSLIYDAISTNGAPLVTTCAVSNDPRATTPPVRLFVVDCSGKPGVNSPKWTANLSYEHRFKLGGDYELTAGAHSRIESSSFLNLDYLDYQKRGAYSSTDAFLTLSSGRTWSLTGFVNNIENEAVKAGGLTRPITNVTLLTVRPPRTFGARVGYHF